jgi:hypothetical protein
MERRVFFGVACSMLAALGACDWVAGKELRVGESTAEDVRRLMGTPATIREKDDGSKIYEYPRGPEGTQTWMVEIGPDDRYRGRTDALAPGNLAKVRTGMTRDEVQALLGTPGENGPLPGKPGIAWTWRVQVGPGVTEMFHVLFGADGRVSEVDRSPDPRTVNTR